MKKFKKIFAVILSLAMVLGMSMTSLAAKPSGNDTAKVTIKGLTGEPKVTLYQVVAGDYGTNGLLGWKVVKDYKNKDDESIISLENGKKWQPGSEEITALANALAADSSAVVVESGKANADGVFTANVKAGAYIAIITGANDQSVYNPIILSASYDEDSAIVGGEVTAGGPGSYLYGLSAVAKKTTASISKEISDGTEPDESNTGKPVETASIGDAVTYTIKPTMPSYPAGAVNKTVYVSDTMVAGLKFIPDSMEITFAEDESVKINTSEIDTNGVITFTKEDGTVIAYAKPNETGFNLRFIYNALANGAQGAVFTPVITYQAVITEAAVVGKDGNTNTVTLYYANKPNTGSDYEDLDEEPENPDPENPDYNTDTDDAVVHTYQLAIRKVDSEDTEDLLPGAVFGVYTDESCTNMIDKIITDDNGIAVSTKVEAGDYWVKELVAPNGYSISEEPVKITANWMSTTTTVTTTTKATRFVETTPGADDQIGWLDDKGNFYRSNEKVNAIAMKRGWKAAKIVEDTNVSTDTTTVETTEAAAAAGTILTPITNITIAALPSTGGIGTTIFTIGGCIIMVVAAALFFASRRKSAK